MFIKWSKFQFEDALELKIVYQTHLHSKIFVENPYNYPSYFRLSLSMQNTSKVKSV